MLHVLNFTTRYICPIHVFYDVIPKRKKLYAKCLFRDLSIGRTQESKLDVLLNRTKLVFTSIFCINYYYGSFSHFTCGLNHFNSHINRELITYDMYIVAER